MKGMQSFLDFPAVLLVFVASWSTRQHVEHRVPATRKHFRKSYQKEKRIELDCKPLQLQRDVLCLQSLHKQGSDHYGTNTACLEQCQGFQIRLAPEENKIN